MHRPPQLRVKTRRGVLLRCHRESHKNSDWKMLNVLHGHARRKLNCQHFPKPLGEYNRQRRQGLIVTLIWCLFTAQPRTIKLTQPTPQLCRPKIYIATRSTNFSHTWQEECRGWGGGGRSNNYAPTQIEWSLTTIDRLIPHFPVANWNPIYWKLWKIITHTISLRGHLNPYNCGKLQLNALIVSFVKLMKTTLCPLLFLLFFIRKEEKEREKSLIPP